MKKIGICIITSMMMIACSNTKTSTAEPTVDVAVGPEFSADSALLYCQQQCDFGPRTMNSEAHERCGEWIAKKFESLGLEVTLQKAVLKGYDGTKLNATNIIAKYCPEAKDRIMICAHWDSRPWADNDPDEANHKKPVMAANDGASGIGVMLEIARLLSEELRVKSEKFATAKNKLGIDFVCFDAEDWGTPEWEDHDGSEGDTWALGAQHWAEQYYKEQSSNTQSSDSKIHYGILLDMVGGQGARFYHEGVSLHYAPDVVRKVWQAAETAGYGSFFPQEDDGTITDDHVPVNQKAGIPCIDIIPYYADCEQSSFGPTWHTVNDDMQHLDKNTLKAVGQTLVQVIFEELKN